MIRLRYHVPAYVDCGPLGEEVFSTQEEMLASERVQLFAKNYDVAYGIPGKGPVLGPGDFFNAFALSNDCLMAIRNNGAIWRVIGHIIEGIDQLDLPNIKYVTAYRDKNGSVTVAVL